MSANQTQHGSAFEWALAEATAKTYKCPITQNKSAQRAKNHYNTLNKKLQTNYTQAATTAAKQLHTLEKTKTDRHNPNTLHVELTTPSIGQGQNGADVRNTLQPNTPKPLQPPHRVCQPTQPIHHRTKTHPTKNGYRKRMDYIYHTHPNTANHTKT